MLTANCVIFPRSTLTNYVCLLESNRLLTLIILETYYVYFDKTVWLHMRCPGQHAQIQIVLLGAPKEQATFYNYIFFCLVIFYREERGGWRTNNHVILQQGVGGGGSGPPAPSGSAQVVFTSYCFT